MPAVSPDGRQRLWGVKLEAVSLGLGAAPVGGYEDSKVATALSLAKGDLPPYMIAVGDVRGRVTRAADAPLHFRAPQ